MALSRDLFKIIYKPNDIIESCQKYKTNKFEQIAINIIDEWLRCQYAKYIKKENEIEKIVNNYLSSYEVVMEKHAPPIKSLKKRGLSAQKLTKDNLCNAFYHNKNLIKLKRELNILDEVFKDQIKEIIDRWFIKKTDILYNSIKKVIEDFINNFLSSYEVVLDNNNQQNPCIKYKNKLGDFVYIDLKTLSNNLIGKKEIIRLKKDYKKPKNIENLIKEFGKEELIVTCIYQLWSENRFDWDNFIKQFDDNKLKENEKNKPIIKKLAKLLNCTSDKLNSDKINDLDDEIKNNAKRTIDARLRQLQQKEKQFKQSKNDKLKIFNKWEKQLEHEEKNFEQY